jgi:hypothetical protein
MSNRAIRNNQLNFDPMNKDKYAFFKDIHANLNPAKDITVWNFLQEATQHNVEIGGVTAYDYRQKVQTLTQGLIFDGLHQTMTHLFSVMLTELLEQAMNTNNRRATFLDIMTKMRNMMAQDANLTWMNSPNHPHFNQVFVDEVEKAQNLLNELSEEVVSKFNIQQSSSLLQPRWYQNMFHAGTDDAQLEVMVNHPSSYFFNVNTNYIIPYLSYDSYDNSTRFLALTDLLNLTDAEMEDMVLRLKENHPRLHLEIASLHEFALANPQVASMAQSWTSRYQASWCFFKQHYTDITKKNTISCGLISDLFGKHTPTYAGLKKDWEQRISDMVDDMKNAEPALEKAKKIEEENQNKTAENIEKAIKAKLNEMLSNGNDDEQSDALTLIGNLAGIQGHHLSQNHTTTYYSHAYGQDQILYLHWNALLQYKVGMDGIVLTDAQKEIIATRYQDRRKELIDSHARRCAQLARQIASETTLHDDALKAMQNSFVSYNALV